MTWLTNVTWNDVALSIFRSTTSHCDVRKESPKKNRDAILVASLFRRSDFAIRELPTDLSVIREVQVVRAGIQINPALYHCA